jgi:Ni/Co efflux regulator RcnB
MKLSKATAVAFACAALLATSPAHADKSGHGRGHDKHQEWSHNDDDNDRRRGPDIIVIDNRDRTVIRQYVEQDYRRHCPPGLAKKHNGCLPPGQAKKKYRVGYVLPRDVEYRPVPRDLLVQLQPVPSGYEYVQVDKDVLLMSEATKKVIDAITLYSAVGQ